MNEQDLVQRLLEAVAAGDEEAAEKASQACAGRAAVVPALRPLLADPDSDRRWWAVRTLALTGGETISLLVDRLLDSDVATRCAAALALGGHGAVDAIPALVERLADESGWVRDSAADALALIGEPAILALIGALKDPRDGVRVRAAYALRRLLVTMTPRGSHIEIQSVQGRGIGALFVALNDPNYLVHQHAYEALDRMGLLDNLIVI